jgi:Flp pilus assembly protein TadD
MVLALAPVARATLQSDYLEIYLKLNDSERLERNGDFRGALEGFEDCYAKLHKIHTNNPDWESVLVTSRMEDCRAKITELQPKVEESVQSTPPAALTPSAGPAPVAAPVGLDDAAALKSRLQEVESELAQTRQQFTDMQQKYQSSQEQVQTLQAQLTTVNDQLTALKSSQTVDQNVGQLMAQNRELTERLTAAQSEIHTLSGSPGSRASRLVAQLKALQEKLAASEAANAGLTETTTTLRSQLDQAQNDLAIANQKLAAAGPGTPEYLTLKHENEVMRGILVREIQEQARRDGAKRVAQEEFDRLKINSRVLQEQLDILGSPMTPPSNDEERSLLTSLKTGNGGVMPMTDNGTGGNNVAATTTGAPVTENNVPAATPTPASSDTNPAANPAPPGPAPAANAMAGTTPPAAPTGTPPADTNAMAQATPPAETNAPAATNTAAANPAPPATNVAPAGEPNVTVVTNAPPATNAVPTPAPAMASETNAPPAAATPPTNTAAATPPAASPETNAASTTPPSAPETNTAAATPPSSASPGAAAGNTPPASADQAQSDATRYSYKPRLPDDMREVAQEATDLFKMQRYDEAAAKYQMIIDKYPESLYAWSNLGVVRSQEGKLQEAMKALQQAVKLSPNDAFSYRNLGIVYYQLNQNDAAIDALERSIALDPNNVYSHDYLGCACSQKGWQEVAEKEFQKAIEINDDFPDAHYNLAIVYAMQKPPALELARRNYKRALELGLPKDPRLEKLLGI